MAMSRYVAGLRRRIGHDLLLLPSVTAAIFDEARRMLLVHDASTDCWVAPGGSIEPGERPADAVVREVREEVGLVVVPSRLLGVFGGPEFTVRYANGDMTSYVMSVFECAVTGGELRADGDELTSVAWVGAERLPDLALAPWARVVLPGLFDASVRRSHAT